MEKLIVKKYSRFPRLRLPEYKERPVSRILSSPVADIKKSRHYPIIKMPAQPQGYIKCREHDCL